MKVRTVITTVIEFDINKEYYPKDSSDEQILAIEKENAEQDPYAFMELDCASTTVTCERIEKEIR